MRALYTILPSVILFFAVHTVSVAQSVNITETFKESFNETVLKVHDAENEIEKRSILNDSFDKMILAIGRIESLTTLDKTEHSQLISFKNEITEKQNELNGLKGFRRIEGEDLDDFTDYSQQYFEQAERTVTIGLTAALLILLILILL
ncbi:MAG: hypothetical protein WD315_06665 [Balneolaceae bacterium]